MLSPGVRSEFLHRLYKVHSPLRCQGQRHMQFRPGDCRGRDAVHALQRGLHRVPGRVRLRHGGRRVEGQGHLLLRSERYAEAGRNVQQRIGCALAHTFKCCGQ